MSALEDDDIFYGCVVCSGEKKRRRNGSNGSRCMHNSCKEELTRRNKGLREQAPVGDVVVDSDPTECFKIKEVLGVSMCLKMTKTEKRLGCDYGDDDCYYQVRGKYGGSKGEDEDDMLSDTRWVPLQQLALNMDESQLSELDKWAGQLQKAAKNARKRVRILQESDD